MATFILIPGAMHGAWTWDRVVPLLEAAGHTAIAPDLPGMRGNESVAPEAVTLGLWGEFVAGLVRAAKLPVILVAHSRGGIVIGDAAERVPELVTGLIYLSALITPPGQTGRGASGVDYDSGAQLPTVADPVPPEVAIPMFYHRCSPEDAAWAASRLGPEPMLPLETPASVTWERWGRLPRAYIACSDDLILTPDRQQRILAAAPCDPVVTLDSDHSPFLGMPERLVQTMLEIARSFMAGLEK